jgi:hypothetical protein
MEPDARHLSDSCFLALHADGWNVGDMAVRDTAGALVWVVCGERLGRQIQGEGATRAEAWQAALYDAWLTLTRPTGHEQN